MTVLLLELNEINFEYVQAYATGGELPRLSALVDKYGISETVSEAEYDHLEPWIQWVTAHTGKTLSEHGVFRLGDIVEHDIEQVWEALERQGLSVGAISPMNAKNRCQRPSFFLPDPWTRTGADGSIVLKKLHAALAQVVNDNADSRLSASSAFWLLAGLATYARPTNYADYLSLAFRSRGRPWNKALLLDQLLADTFIRQVKRTKPDFASLFLNAGAHIQHHYLFNSKYHKGPQANPDWYLPRDADPLLEVYRLYDRIVGEVMDTFPDARFIIATGLHQDPHHEVTYYWRLKDHDAFLKKSGIPFQRAEPRMSRDFVVYCSDEAEAAEAEHQLRLIQRIDGSELFDVDNRGSSLFVMLIWPHDIPPDFQCRSGNRLLAGFRDDVAFVAIKNGHHNGIGYLIDTGAPVRSKDRLPLAQLPNRIADACGAVWS